jgi:hypothetical protein
MIVDVLPALLAMARKLTQRERDAEWQDLMSKVDHVIGAAEFFASDEFDACDPILVDAARQLDQDSTGGFSAFGKLLLLGVLNAHPDVLQLAAERAYDDLLESLRSDMPTR